MTIFWGYIKNYKHGDGVRLW